MNEIVIDNGVYKIDNILKLNNRYLTFDLIFNKKFILYSLLKKINITKNIELKHIISLYESNKFSKYEISLDLENSKDKIILIELHKVLQFLEKVNNIDYIPIDIYNEYIKNVSLEEIHNLYVYKSKILFYKQYLEKGYEYKIIFLHKNEDNSFITIEDIPFPINVDGLSDMVSLKMYVSPEVVEYDSLSEVIKTITF